MNAVALIAALYGFGLGVLTALGWRLTAGPESDSEPLEYKPVVGHHALLHKSLLEPTEFPQGSNFDYLCEWTPEDVELAYFGDRWTSRN